MAAIPQTTFSNTFSWMKILEHRLKFHWSLFLRVQINNIPAIIWTNGGYITVAYMRHSASVSKRSDLRMPMSANLYEILCFDFMWCHKNMKIFNSGNKKITQQCISQINFNAYHLKFTHETLFLFTVNDVQPIFTMAYFTSKRPNSLQWRHDESPRLKSPASGLFTQPFVQAQTKDNTKASRHWPFWREFTGQRWIPSQRTSNAEKGFHLMTSSYSSTGTSFYHM